MRRKRVTARTKHERAKRQGIAALGGYDAVLRDQGGVCAICRKPPKVGGRRLHIDHDHKTGKVRGLLCARCNRGLAWFCDDPHRLTVASWYLLGVANDDAL